MVSYNPMLHVSAKRELYDLPATERAELRAVLKEVAAEEQPSHHPKSKPMVGQPGIFRVRVGNCRAICTLQKPDLLILAVGKRNGVYESVDEVITERAPPRATA